MPCATLSLTSVYIAARNPSSVKHAARGLAFNVILLRTPEYIAGRNRLSAISVIGVLAYITTW